MNRIVNIIVVFLGALFVWAGVYKIIHPAVAEAGLESLELPSTLARSVVAATTIVELYLGMLLLLGINRRAVLNASLWLMVVFTGYIFYLSMLANPPSCGCLGLAGIFQSAKGEAHFALSRNVVVIWGIAWCIKQHQRGDGMEIVGAFSRKRPGEEVSGAQSV